MTNQNRAAALARIQALLKKTVENGCTEAEAMAAAQKAGELMDRYSLTLSDVEIREEKCRLKGTIDNGHEVRFCMETIGRYCGCKSWRDRNTGKITFFGLPHDAEVADYLADLIRVAMDTSFKAFLRSPERDPSVHGRTLRKTFMISMANRINERLKAMIKAREAEAKTASGTALVVVRNAVVNEQFGQLGIKLKPGRSTRYRINPAAENAGRAAGDRVNLTTGLNGGRRAGAIAG